VCVLANDGGGVGRGGQGGGGRDALARWMPIRNVDMACRVSSAGLQRGGPSESVAC